MVVLPLAGEIAVVIDGVTVATAPVVTKAKVEESVSPDRSV